MMQINEQPLRVLVFGAGAIGTYLGCSLYMSGCPVVFLEKAIVVEELRQRGIHLKLPEREVKIEAPLVVASVQEALNSSAFDYAIFALKSFDTASAVLELAEYKNQLPPFLCLQNGVDNESILGTEFGAGNVIAGTVTSSIQRRSAGEVVLERKRGIGVAGNHRLSAALCNSLNRAELNAKIYDRPLDMKWSKLLTNLLANASSAILDMTPAQIFAHPGLFQLECWQIREARTVMRALEVQTVDLPATPVRLLAFAMQNLPLWLSRPFIQRRVGAGRGGKMPSLHMDLSSGRKFSEVEELNGAVYRYGQKLGIATPANELLYRTLLSLVSQEIPWETYRRQPEKLLSKWKINQ